MRTFRAAFCVVVALALGGCISLFPKAPPAQLYRFGAETPPAASPPAGRSFNVSRIATVFAQAASGDRLLTTSGTEAAYIAAARWEAPAAILFDDAESRAFENSGGPARLLRSSDTASATVSLRLDVESFEARYENGPKAPPTVVVTVHAMLVDVLDRRVLGDQTFVSRQPASDNRVGAIVDGFNAATTDVLGRVVAWTNQQGQGIG